MMALLPTPASPIRIGLFFLRRESIWDYALDLLLAPHDGVDLALAGHLREVYAELVEHVRCVFLFGFVFLAEVEHVYLYLRAEVVAGGEFLDVFGYDFARDAVHFEYARCRGRAVADDGSQRVGRRNGSAWRPIRRTTRR